MKNHVNRHHVWYTRAEYRGDRVYGRLREMSGFVILMSMDDHRDLHQDIWSSTPRPDRDLAIALMRELPPRETAQPRDYQLQFAIGFLALHDEQLVADHLHTQLGYIMNTPLTGEVYGK